MKQHKAMRRFREFLRHRQHPIKIIGYTSKTMWLLLIPLVKYLVALKFDIRSWLVTNWVDILAIVAIFAFALSLVAAVYYLRIAFVLFAPNKKPCECKCSCMPPSYSYMLKFMVAVAAIALLALSVVPGFALIG